MVVLQIKHPVPDFSGWKKAFDKDPVGQGSIGCKTL
jgi:hypothetical protein